MTTAREITFTPEQAALFWSRVEKRGPNECWPWIGISRSNGYGIVGRNQGNIVAHRAAYVLCVGPIPDGLMACHKCDNRGCVNPNHLFLGTAKDNTHDMLAKGREAHGESHGIAKLTAAHAVRIRHLVRSGASVSAVAAAFGVCHETVRLIGLGKRWARAIHEYSQPVANEEEA